MLAYVVRRIALAIPVLVALTVVTYALLSVNKSPSQEEIAEALSGNICRCSEYPQIYDSVNAAAAELRGEKTIVLSGTGTGGEGGELEDPSLAE